jgi:hypothetical protein
MRQETVNICKFEELPEKIQQKLIDKYRYTRVDYDWWEYIADEIKDLGGKLVEFDTYRHSIKLKIDYPIDFAKAIVALHGSSCDTYIISEDFINGELSGKEYVEAIAEQYLSILRLEYEYLTSDEYVREELIDIDDEYYEDGREI